jgi:hypothetical protein
MGEKAARKRQVATAQVSPVTATAAHMGRLLIQLKMDVITERMK